MDGIDHIITSLKLFPFCGGRGSASLRRRPWDSNSARKTWSEDRRGQDRRAITIQLGPPGSSLRLQCYRCLFLAFQSLGKQWSNRHNTNDRNYIDRRGLSLHNHHYYIIRNHYIIAQLVQSLPAWLSPCEEPEQLEGHTPSAWVVGPGRPLGWCTGRGPRFQW